MKGKDDVVEGTKIAVFRTNLYYDKTSIFQCLMVLED